MAILNPKSAPQGAALLTASDPARAMVAHESSLMAGRSGVIATGSVSPAMEAVIRGNNALFNQLKIEAVPFIIVKNAHR